MDGAIISGANPIPWEHGGRGRQRYRGAGRHVRARRPIWVEIGKARTATRMRQRKMRVGVACSQSRAAVRFRKRKSPPPSPARTSKLSRWCQCAGDLPDESNLMKSRRSGVRSRRL